MAHTDLAPFIDTWLDVTEIVTYGYSGTYELEIKKVIDNTILFKYSNDSIINWRPGNTFVRPKWGIYRSLINEQDLRDETVFFANFSIEEIDVVSTSDNLDQKSNFQITCTNPAENNIIINNIPENINVVQIFNLEGGKVIDEPIGLVKELNLDVSSLSKGIYILKFIGHQMYQTELILIR